jgi:hypothetical protein
LGKKMKRTPLRKQSKSETATLKREIQKLVREIVIARDGGCILRGIRHCGGEIGEAVLQADHLLPRNESGTYADTRLIVCVCRPCHGGFKKWHKEEYDRIVKSILPKERVELWEKCETSMPAFRGSYDWKLAILALKQELRKIKN